MANVLYKLNQREKNKFITKKFIPNTSKIIGYAPTPPLSPVLSWVQIGQLIDVGYRCDIDASGNRIVINRTQLGGSSTHVYDWDGTNWVQLGNTITGTYTFGINDYTVEAGSLAISADGIWVAIGASREPFDQGDASVVTVFKWDGTNWILYTVLEGLGGPFDYFGSDITFNSLGGNDALLVIGATGGDDNYNGTMYGYGLEEQNNGLFWIKQFGSAQTPTAFGDIGRWGRASVSGGGKVIFGNPSYIEQDDGLQVGRVYFDNFSGGPTTVIDGENDGDKFGDSVSINEAGTRCAIMAKLAIVSEVKVYDLDGINWIQVGNTIQVPRGSAGISGIPVQVELNAAGDRLVICSSYNWDPESATPPQVVIKTFKLVDNNWEQFGSDILGADNVDWNTTDMKVNAAGDRIVFRSFGNNFVPEPGSDVRVYSLESQ
jgi:hypothetical protein